MNMNNETFPLLMLQVTGNPNVNSLCLIKFNRTQSNAIEHNQISWIIIKCKISIDVQLP